MSGYRYALKLALLAAGGGLAGLATNLALQANNGESLLLQGFLLFVAVGLAGGVAAQALSSGRSIRGETTVAEAQFQEAAANAVAAIESTLPAGQLSIEQEVAEVTNTLTAVVNRLGDISRKAEAYGSEVKRLIDQAEQAKALAEINEDTANKIAHILGRETDSTLKEEMARLTRMHVEELGKLRRSGNRVAWITFVAGGVVGFITNVVTTVLMG
ncbi:MAG TPA: hypothetical protein VFC19_41365 [Candidatus Limnocylindrales bacterium]|nr:hypothetical protein [Candidatus Limnocylindrales bacterium]